MALGSLLGSNNLAKLTIRYEKARAKDWRGKIEALFNPSEFQISRSINWETIGGEAVGQQSIVEQQFQSVAPRTTSIDLFFDSYEKHGGLGIMGYLPNINPFPTPDATDVRKYTDELAKLAEVNKELHRPPICKLEWGAFDNIFTGVLTNVSHNYTMFMPNGMPVRATVSCSFTEHELTGTELFSPDVHKTYTVGRRDTLHSIAAHMYNDSSHWRTIARANGIRNPRLLTPGTVLMIPKLT